MLCDALARRTCSDAARGESIFCGPPGSVERQQASSLRPARQRAGAEKCWRILRADRWAGTATVCQVLADNVLALLKVGSAGVSVIEHLN
jgi:hypothetical protein